MTPDTHPHQDLVQAHLEVALGSFLTALYREPDWLGGYSADIDDHFWNFAVPLRPDPAGMEEMMGFFDGLERSPTLWGEPRMLDAVQDHLGIGELETAFTDAWMVSDGGLDAPSDAYEYRAVSSSEEKALFLEIFGQAFGGSEDDDQPYSGLGEGYRRGIRRALDGDWGSGESENVLVYRDGEPVSIGTLAVHDGLAFVYNIATLPDHQGQGLGTAATRYIVQQADRYDPDRIVLQTEQDSKVQSFYEDLGFETIFTMEGRTGL